MNCSEDLKYVAPEDSVDVKQLYANVLMGLHAASQPLTVLRTGWWADGVQELTAPELQDLAEISADAVERTCALFNLTRDLVNAEGTPPIRNPFDLTTVLRELEAQFTPEFERAGIGLDFCIENSLAKTLGDPSLASQAIAAALKMAKSISFPRDRVLVSVFGAGPDNHIEVQTANSAFSAEAEVKLHLALVGSLLRKQSATFTHQLEPFHLRMRFKQAQAASRSVIA